MNKIPNYRKNIRLKGYDYSTENYYFVTICTKNRLDYFLPYVYPKNGNLSFVTTPIGSDNKIYPGVAAQSYCAQKINSEIIINKINLIPKYYNSKIDFYCLMPDHLHVIIYIFHNLNYESALRMRSYNQKDKKSNLPQIIRSFKSWTKRNSKIDFWQPNYYEHIIRNEKSLEKIREYILHNPEVEYEDINWQILDPAV